MQATLASCGPHDPASGRTNDFRSNSPLGMTTFSASATLRRAVCGELLALLRRNYHSLLTLSSLIPLPDHAHSIFRVLRDSTAVVEAAA